MAIEAKRGCGYRKVGGLYLMGHGDGLACDRLPLRLGICPCCSQGIKQSRGWTWVEVNLLVGGVHRNCKDPFPCPLCMATSEIGKAGLLWIGEKFYPTLLDFMREAQSLGISRRISAVPRAFEVGKTWVLLAHPKAVICRDCYGAGIRVGGDFRDLPAPCTECKGAGKVPGIFRVFQPHAIEKIITKTQSEDAAFMEGLKRQGLTPVIVPDDDPDHQGTVWDKVEETEEVEVAG